MVSYLPGRHAGGFTIFELLTTLAVVAIVLSVGVPSFVSLDRSSRIVSAANDLVSAMSIARSEAIRRGAAIGMCPSEDGGTCTDTWASGWIVFADGAATDTADPIVSQILEVWEAPALDASVVTESNGSVADVSWIRFMPRGNARATAAFPIVFHIEIDGCIGDAARDIELSSVGRAASGVGDCS